MPLYQVLCEDREGNQKHKYLSASNLIDAENDFHQLEPDLKIIEVKSL